MRTGNNQQLRATGMGAVLHFLVDGLCACCLLLLASSAAAGVAFFVLYNVLAFLTQPLTGMLADRLHPVHWLLTGAVALLALAVLAAAVTPGTSPVGMAVVAVLLGMGNSLFHVWGGKVVASSSGNDPRALGVFVSTGAFGLAVGGVFYSWGLLFALLVAVSVLTAAAVRQVASPASPVSSGSPVQPSKVHRPQGPWLAWLMVLAVMALVMLRSVASAQFSAGLAAGGMGVLALGATTMLGKAAGGWAARALGIGQTLVLAVAGVAACLLLASGRTPVLLAGLLLANCTMAVTLWLANAAMPGREGLVFGLLAAALMPGYLVAQTGVAAQALLPPLLLALAPTIVIELGVLWLLRERRADVLASSVAVNVLTNVPLNLLLRCVGLTWPAVLVGEAAVVIVEALWYCHFVGCLRRAAVYSLLCNSMSFLLGLLVQLLAIYFKTLV